MIDQNGKLADYTLGVLVMQHFFFSTRRISFIEISNVEIQEAAR